MGQVTSKKYDTFPPEFSLWIYMLHRYWLEVEVSYRICSGSWTAKAEHFSKGSFIYLSTCWEMGGVWCRFLSYGMESFRLTWAFPCVPLTLSPVNRSWCTQLQQTHPFVKQAVQLKAKTVQGLNPPGSTLTIAHVGPIFQLACICSELFL